MSEETKRATRVIRTFLEGFLEKWQETTPGVFNLELPGTRKLAVACTLLVSERTVTISAFVARRPDENHEAVYRWLLEHNARLRGIAFVLDHVGDIYLRGHIPLHAVTESELDQRLGVLLDAADSSFNTILELGFAESIRREWRWRLARGEPTKNLEFFTHLRPPDADG